MHCTAVVYALRSLPVIESLAHALAIYELLHVVARREKAVPVFSNSGIRYRALLGAVDLELLERYNRLVL